MDYLMDRLDSRRGDRARSRDYEDERRGVRGSGRRDRRDSRDYRDYEDERDYEDDRRDSEDSRDYEDGRRRFSYEDGNHLKLTKSDMHEWKRMLENADGTRGPHYDAQQIMSVAEKHNIRFKDFSEAELCLATNMMYADYCHALKKFIEQDKMLECCICLAKAFLEDEDGPEASEKLALYYHCIVNA
jgi:hypothetical protein